MSTTLTATVLVENSRAQGLACEHGLSVYLHYHRADSETRVLLDFGQSDAFVRNADALDVDLAAVDLAVLSHAHYDHANGMPAFFARNDHAALHLSAACAENCWSTKAGTTEPHYIGIEEGLLARYASRLAPASTTRTTTVADGVHLVPHTTPHLERLGEQAGMLLRTRDSWQPDDYAHELSLVFELDDSPSSSNRLAVFNSCSHAGLPAIAAEVHEAFPGATIAVFVGGLHLIHSSDEGIRQVAHTVLDAGIGHLYTGHCTGEHALELLSRHLPERVTALHPGLQLVL